MRMEIIGGDERMLRLSARLRNRGNEVSTLGLMEHDDQTCPRFRAQVLVFPYPYAVRSGRVPCLTGLTLSPEDALSRCEDDATIVGGHGLAPYVATARALGRGLKLLEFGSDEVLTRENAELSAEGALAAALRESSDAVWQSRCIIVGYGRLGRALSRRLTALGAQVTVIARREKARVQAREDGMRACDFAALPEEAKRCRRLFNTVPAQLISLETLHSLPEDAALYELASEPYGYSQKQAAELGLHTAVLGAIPARHAPRSAANALLDSLDHLLLKGGAL